MGPPLSTWPWENLGIFKYLLYGPFVAKVVYEWFYNEEHSYYNLSWCLHLLILSGLRGLIHVLWGSYSHMLFLTRNRRILQQGVDFKQIDKEWDWDNFLILQALVASMACYMFPFLQHLPLWNVKGLFVLEHVHSKEADTLAISELNRALDKKERVLSELKHMNDGISESQKYGDSSVKDSELFKRDYASVLKQLTDANEQVSSALFCLRQRNTYQASSSVFQLKPMANFDDPSGQASSSNCSACQNQESISQSHIAEIVESSRRKARTMVVQASQAMSNLRTTESKVERIEDAINFINNQLSVDEPTASSTTFVPADSLSHASQDQLTASVLNPLASCHVQDTELNSSSDQNEMKIPSELISHCLATLFMIQKCTERQFPPADVAQVLDSAVTSLQPLCSKNLPIYGEIQKCMGIIRNQILALIPT